MTLLPSFGNHVHVAQRRHAYTEQTLDELQGQLPLPDRLQRAVLRRRIDFLAGRWCARQALHQAGTDVVLPLSTGEHGSPVWPSGWVGSISHAHGWAVAAAASADHVKALGVDIERKLSAEVAGTVHHQIAHDVEVVLLSDRCIDRETGLSVLFSAKESLFKALYPQVRCYFDFLDATLDAIDEGEGVLSLRLLKTLSDDHREHATYPIRYAWLEDRVLTWCVLPAER